VPSRLIHLCYNGIEAALYPPAPEPRADPVVIGVVCALRPEKGVDTLLEAFAGLGLRPDARLLVVGSGPSLPGLQALAARFGLADRCAFEPATKDVAGRLRQIDIFVLPSLSEAFSNSLMEAMACGCCVVASRVGGNPELVIDGEVGVLFRAGDSAELTRVLDRLLNDSALRAHLAAAGSERIRRQFTMAQATQRMGAIYREVLA
jgi:glycosyltransferase involved in cell wall biosynthesis